MKVKQSVEERRVFAWEKDLMVMADYLAPLWGLKNRSSARTTLLSIRSGKNRLPPNWLPDLLKVTGYQDLDALKKAWPELKTTDRIRNRCASFQEEKPIFDISLAIDYQTSLTRAQVISLLEAIQTLRELDIPVDFSMTTIKEKPAKE